MSNFGRGRGYVNQEFGVRQMCETYLVKCRDAFWAFMNSEKILTQFIEEFLVALILYTGWVAVC